MHFLQFPDTEEAAKNEQQQAYLRDKYQLPEQARHITEWLPCAKPVFAQFGVVIKREPGEVTYKLHNREYKIELPADNV